VSVKRRDRIKHFQQHGFSLLREGRRHSIYSNELCKQAGIPPKF
jgi:hypothetical protein